MEEILQKYYGYQNFREGQGALIDYAVEGRSALGILPTGGGKSICYQVPGIALGGLTLVISPLISLMKDQVDALTAAGIEAAYLNSQQKEAEARAIERGLIKGEYRFLYVAPERFDKNDFRYLLSRLDIRLIAFDEAHCISKWGHDFRPSYRQVVGRVMSLGAPCMAVTATATADVRKDIQSLLHISDDCVVETSIKRDNLAFKVDPTFQKDKMVRRYIKEHPDDSGIIYATTRKQVEALSEQFRDFKISHTIYHAGLPAEVRAENQTAFVNDNCSVMIATNAFGMGIDKSNVRYVIHYNLPQDLESYYQEAGRAGRDGLTSECILLYSDQDIRLQQFFIGNTQDEVIQDMKKEKLEKMVQYTKTTQCLQGTLINYFNSEEHLEPCGKCTNCLMEADYDMTTEAKKLLSCLLRMKTPVNRSVLTKVIRGESFPRHDFEHLSTFGLMKEYETKAINGFIDTLLFNGYVDEIDGRLSVHPSAKEVLLENMQIMTHYHPVDYNERVTIHTLVTVDDALFDVLKKVRKTLAEEMKIPPFTIFSDRTLTLFAQKQPTTKQEMFQIEGVGSYKLKHYCPRFIEAIKSYQTTV
ncbi:DNA helicase RecQ [Macrococcus carouselicus]|uniref:DNA helicase RecQ n=1 Tax=Macrococcus carouselicus TaxID=69969 RepID=A0A9Q8FRD9_9STAP|nr:DNA helicase RecQ [Macrococcus carouselicus]